MFKYTYYIKIRDNNKIIIKVIDYVTKKTMRGFPFSTGERMFFFCDFLNRLLLLSLDLSVDY